MLVIPLGTTMTGPGMAMGMGMGIIGWDVTPPTNNPPIPPKTIGQSRFQNQEKNTISSIIGSYKSVVTKNARFTDPHFAWQSRFHDHIIRNSESFQRIQNYILNSPGNWEKDKFYE